MGQVRDGLWRGWKGVYSRGKVGKGGVLRGKGEVRDRCGRGTECLRDYKGF